MAKSKNMDEFNKYNVEAFFFKAGTEVFLLYNSIYIKLIPGQVNHSINWEGKEGSFWGTRIFYSFLNPETD